MITQKDLIHRFLFEDAPIRGEIVHLAQTIQETSKHQNYPACIQKLLGEMLAATSLLSETIKFEGEITIQIQSEGPLSLAVVTSTHEHQIRSVARFEAEAIQKIPTNPSLAQLTPNGVLVITISPNEGQRYQGIVKLDQATFAECLESYFAQSEQLQTRVWLFANETQAAGMLLQALPIKSKEEQAQQDKLFQHLEVLTDTVKPTELYSLPAQEVLTRLYHEENLELFEPKPVSFQCTCSQDRIQQTLLSMRESEVKSLLIENPVIRVNCEFCGQNYEFDSVDVEALFRQAPKNTSSQQH